MLKTPQSGKVFRYAVLRGGLGGKLGHAIEPCDLALDARLLGHRVDRVGIIQRTDGDLVIRIAIFAHEQRRSAGPAKSAAHNGRRPEDCGLATRPDEAICCNAHQCCAEIAECLLAHTAMANPCLSQGPSDAVAHSATLASACVRLVPKGILYHASFSLARARTDVQRWVGPVRVHQCLGQIWGMAEMANDRSAQDRIQDAAVLRDILDHLPTSIFAKDEELRFIYSNEAHCRIIGQPEDMLLGQSDADFYPANEAEQFLARDRQVLETGEIIESEEEATGSSGITLPVLTRKTRLTTPDGKHYLIGTNTDLTDVRKREAQYRALAQTVPVGVWQVDENSHTIFANPRFLTYLGIDIEALPDTDISLVLGGAREDFPGKASRFETDLTSTSGEERRVLVISSGWLELSANQIRSAIVSVVDISEMTQLKRVNDEISRLNAELADNVRKLKDAQDEVLRRGRMAQLGQLTATVAHEIRNPLGAVRTAAFLMERKLKGKELGVEPQLVRISNGITRCDNIISQLLDFSRSRALQFETIGVDDWLGKVIGEEAERLPAAITIECQFGLVGIAAAVDPPRMGRVIVNLVSNAAEAMVGKGDDPESFTTADPRILITTTLSQRGAEISVSDNGPGISDETLKRILEPLFTTKSFGTGLGLPAAEKILQDHHGGLEVRSAPGAGATFTAWFPLQQGAADAA